MQNERKHEKLEAVATRRGGRLIIRSDIVCLMIPRQDAEQDRRQWNTNSAQVSVPVGRTLCLEVCQLIRCHHRITVRHC